MTLSRRPAAGAGSAGGSRAVYNWTYQFSGELLVLAGTTNAIAAGLLMRASAPRNSAAERGGNTQNFRRLLNALKKIASSRSDYFKSAIEDATTPADEISEYIADTWRKMVDSGYPFKFGDRVSQRNMELNSASSLAFGTVAKEELRFREMLPMKIGASSIISKCVRSSSGSEQPSEILEAFEQLADICFPGSFALHETWLVAISSTTACCATVVAHVIFRLHSFVLAQGVLAVQTAWKKCACF